MMDYQLYIDGAFVAAQDGSLMDTVDPYTNRSWARIPRASAGDVDRAVRAAQAAMTSGPWATYSASQRGRALCAVADRIEQNADRLAQIETRDNGKVLRETRTQLQMIADVWRYYGGLADKIEGHVIPVDKADTLAYSTREPIGVVGALTAWNSPLWFAAIKCAPALAAGCSVVLKPSEFTSASSLELAALIHESGLPAGVFNVITGLGSEVGSALVDHRGVAKLTFTGSDATGIRIYEKGARLMKRVSLELGGKSPNIVFADADLDAAADGVVSGIFGASGQMCTAGSRLLVHNSIMQAFGDAVLARARRIRLGDPSDPETDVGPVGTSPQFEKILSYFAVAEAEGAVCLTGGHAATGANLGEGQFVEPTIYLNVNNSMRIAQEEIFGPVLCILGFDTEEEAIQLANDVEYGLVAGVWTRDLGRILRMTKALKVGTVWVNTYRMYSYMVPFGGIKRSGIGRESGIEAVNEYLETKSVFISAASGSARDAFVMK